MAAEKSSSEKRALPSKTASGPAKPGTSSGRWDGPKSCRPDPQTAVFVVDVRSATWMACRTSFP